MTSHQPDHVDGRWSGTAHCWQWWCPRYFRSDDMLTAGQKLTLHMVTRHPRLWGKVYRRSVDTASRRRGERG